jgi:UDP-N-acetyl-2-amino-2-deoxyglucuronate dehydrogenase
LKKFALTGIAGYIAPRHLKAIKDTCNTLIAGFDPFDSVGILDSYFPDTHFFIEFERFDRHLDKLRRQGKGVDYITICSPNYLHDAQIRFALRNGAHAICEKPLVLNPWNIDALIDLQKEFDKKIYTVLQLRLHPEFIKLKNRVIQSPPKIYDIDLTYITSRGNWYDYSWKGDIAKSGGIATNIGIHFFDMLTWIFGNFINCSVFVREPHRMSGFLQLENANVRWFLSIDNNDLPLNIREEGQRTFRSISIDGSELEFSEGFNELHTETYRQILEGKGFEPEASRVSIEIVHNLRNKSLSNNGDFHPLTSK